MTPVRHTTQTRTGGTVRRSDPRDPVERKARSEDDRQLPQDILTTRVGLRIPAALTFEKWQRAGSQISRIVDSSAWCLGDWLVYGQKEYCDRYLHAVEESGLDYQTLRNYAWVARKFDQERRRETLSFQHHAEVSSLGPDDQDKWLDLAEQYNWSRNELRRNIRAHRQQDGKKEKPRETLPKLAVDAERVRQWRQAAELSSERFENWVLRVLDAAAADLNAQSSE